jgi:hypothetical protein
MRAHSIIRTMPWKLTAGEEAVVDFPKAICFMRESSKTSWCLTGKRSRFAIIIQKLTTAWEWCF